MVATKSFVSVGSRQTGGNHRGVTSTDVANVRCRVEFSRPSQWSALFERVLGGIGADHGQFSFFPRACLLGLFVGNGVRRPLPRRRQGRQFRGVTFFCAERGGSPMLLPSLTLSLSLHALRREVPEVPQMRIVRRFTNSAGLRKTLVMRTT